LANQQNGDCSLLDWITDQAEVALLVTQLGDELTNFLDYSVEEIKSLQEKLLVKTMVHWAKDFDRIDKTPTLDDLNAPQQFLAKLRTAAERARICKQLTTGSEARAKEASSGRLKSEKTWATWEQAFLTQATKCLSWSQWSPTFLQVCERKTPDPEVTLTYMERMVAPQAWLTCPEFEADTLQVHQLICSYTVGENAAQWIREISKHCDGRRDLLALRAHYPGKGNNSRQIATAQQMCTTLHYHHCVVASVLSCSTRTRRNSAPQTFVPNCQ
jgi:hypothetical protein